MDTPRNQVEGKRKCAENWDKRVTFYYFFQSIPYRNFYLCLIIKIIARAPTDGQQNLGENVLNGRKNVSMRCKIERDSRFVEYIRVNLILCCGFYRGCLTETWFGYP